MSTRPLVAAAALAAFLLSATAQAEQAPVCDDRATMMSNLSKEYSEAVRGRGTTNNGWLYEITRSKTGTWTAMVTLPNGMTCLMAAGKWWEDLPAPAPKAVPL